MMSSIERTNTITSLIWKFLERLTAQSITFVVQLVLARILSPEEFGVIAIVLVFVNLANVIVQGGLNTALIQAKEVSDEDCSTVFWMCFLVAAVMYVAIFLVSPFIESFYGIEHLADYLRIAGILVFVNSLFSIQNATMIRNLKFKEIFIATTSGALVSGAVGIAMALGGFGVWSLVIQQLCAQLIASLVYLIVSPWRPSFVFFQERARGFLSYGKNVLFSSIIDALYQNMYDLVIGKAYSSGILAFFNWGRKIPMIMGMLLDGTIQTVMLPVLSRHQDEASKMKSIMRRAIKTSVYVVAPLMVFISVCSQPLIAIVLTEKWLPCVPFLIVFCAVRMFDAITVSNLQAIYASGRSDVILKLELTKKPIAVFIFVLTIILFDDPFYVALGALAYSILATLINAFPNRELIDYSYFEQIRDVAPSIGLSLLCGLITCSLYYLPINDISFLLLAIIIFWGLYVSLSVLMKNENANYLRVTLKEYFKDINK